ncbi:reverse transcriptase domain-containing protein [Tanacetum coccineum]
MLKRCEDTNLVLNWEKCHFMVKEGIILGHKVSGLEIEFDKEKNQGNIQITISHERESHPKLFRACRFLQKAFDKLKYELTHAPIMIKPDWSLPFEVMCNTSEYAVRVVLGQRIKKHFKPTHYASKTMNEAQENYTMTEKEFFAVVFAFEKLCQYLVLSKTIILLLQEFDIEIRDKKGAKNLAANHLSWLENPDLRKLTKAEIRDLFPEERLMEISDKNNEPWYADYAN